MVACFLAVAYAQNTYHYRRQAAPYRNVANAYAFRNPYANYNPYGIRAAYSNGRPVQYRYELDVDSVEDISLEDVYRYNNNLVYRRY